jgi:Xaa-Pro aminopeptidase
MEDNKLGKLREGLESLALEAIIIWNSKNRFYFSGFTGSAGMLLITKEEQYLITDFRYFDQAKEQAPGYQYVFIEKSMTETLEAQLKKLGIKRLGFEENYWTYAEYLRLRERADSMKLSLIPAGELIKELRLIKSEEELEIFRQAAAITDQAFSHVMGVVKPGITEREVAIELEFFMRRKGALGPSFEYIVASGKRGAMPHGVATDKKIVPGELVTIDFGCIYQGYSSDMTRNFIFGQPTDKQVEVYQTVLTAQEKALTEIKAGLNGKEADKLARDIIRANFGDKFGHGLGHGLGLDIHEGPTLGPHSDSVLKPGMVVTVEPGIYLSDWGGVRIEDMIVVQEENCEIFTKSPKHLYII